MPGPGQLGGQPGHDHGLGEAVAHVVRVPRRRVARAAGVREVEPQAHRGAPRGGERGGDLGGEVGQPGPAGDGIRVPGPRREHRVATHDEHQVRRARGGDHRGRHRVLEVEPVGDRERRHQLLGRRGHPGGGGIQAPQLVTGDAVADADAGARLQRRVAGCRGEGARQAGAGGHRGARAGVGEQRVERGGGLGQHHRGRRAGHRRGRHGDGPVEGEDARGDVEHVGGGVAGHGDQGDGRPDQGGEHDPSHPLSLRASARRWARLCSEPRSPP